MVKLAGIACGVVAGFFLLWTVSVFMFIHEASWSSRIFGLLAVAAIVLSWRYAGRILPAIRHQQIRAAAGLLACTAGIGGTLLFVKLALPNFVIGLVGTGAAVNRLFVALVTVWMAMAILGVVAYRPDDAAGKNEKHYV